ncbi:sensor histidine kinase [Planomonospora corallina]|uniref:histidine kinase n=1 Tax=Planomonospora corallina TaxID=1806052 RepID=A0ABV8I1G1_9ACTN
MRVTAWAGLIGRIDPLLADAASAAGLTVITVLWSAMDHSGPWRRPDAVAVLLICLANLPVALRRRAPVAVLVLCSAAAACHHLLGYQPTVNNVAVLLAVYTVAVHRSPRTALAAAAVGTAAWWTASAMAAGGLVVLNGVQSVALVAVATAFGSGVRRLAERNRRLAELTERLRQEQEDRARRAVTEERVRIAGELHDIVAHHMSVISVQAGLARYVFASDPGTARTALATVADTSHEALEEMRRLLAVLRLDRGRGGADGDGDGVYDPTPGLSQLGPLVERVRTAGVPVDVKVTGSVRPLSPGMELCVYRVVQEGLTNVIKHAFPARAGVRLDYGDQALRVTVTDDGSPPAGPRGPLEPVPPGRRGTSGGHGLIGMRERVRLYRGTVISGPRPQGGFEVAVVLPLPSAGGGEPASAERGSQ